MEWCPARKKETTTGIRNETTHCSREVRSLDLKSGDPEFKSRSDHWLDLSQVVPGSTPRLYLVYRFIF